MEGSASSWDKALCMLSPYQQHSCLLSLQQRTRVSVKKVLTCLADCAALAALANISLSKNEEEEEGTATQQADSSCNGRAGQKGSNTWTTRLGQFESNPFSATLHLASSFLASLPT